ncbi:MAG: cytochrome c oxidase subunit 3 [Rhodocyclaceae bacterium]|nr:cytochrome c oxidase subunit 3 [Rhodocyclaceae bacterium]MBX3671063.1 cytochrome c oxidase subunit 3 [Rhodocyclaceae bacterium]
MSQQQHQAPYYYVPAPSTSMIWGSGALLCLAMGTIFWINGRGAGPWLVLAGFGLLLVMLRRWFGQVIGESESGVYSKRVDVSFRWSMSWFIFSEVMFFAAFFGALFYARVLSVPDLATLENQSLLWPGSTTAWPNAGPGFKEFFSPMHAMGIPAINTLLLLTSGVTLTWAHWGLLENNRGQLKMGLFATIALGALFLCLQAYEYIEAYHQLNLKLTTGIYGSTFFMLTGFHGFHVTLGAIMLTVIFVRVLKGHFRADHHFGFEGVAWYWHFVDVVWLLLFIFVYWL